MPPVLGSPPFAVAAYGDRVIIQARALAVATALAVAATALTGAGAASAAVVAMTVSGHVSAPADAAPLVMLYDDAGEPVSSANPDPGGVYTLTVAAAGNYTVGFSDDNAIYVDRYWNGTAAGVVLDDPTDGATYFALAAGQALTGIDGTLGLVSFDATAPTISGKTLVGEYLTLEFGDWYDLADLEIQWMRDGVGIDEAWDEDYEIRPADVGHRLSASVIASADGYNEAQFTTASVMVPGLTLKGSKPAIVGAAVRGTRLSVATGAWTRGTRFTYQWLANGAPIAKSTKATRALSRKLAHKRISVAVTGYKKGYALLTMTSARTKRVK